MEIDRYLHQRKALIDRALDRYLKRRDPRIAPLLHQAMRYSVIDAGKRFRPILTLAVGEMFGAKHALLPFACALELIHCYSLIHDDLPSLDNDDYRRGKLACHKQFGEAIALLAGNALLTEAFFIMSDPRMARVLGADLISKLIREVSDAAGIGGMINGQSKEFELVKRKVTTATLENLDRLKTGALITTAARVGAMIGKAPRKDLDRITRYAQALGLAFQITDDILDAHEVSGYNNNHKGIANYLSVAGRAKATRRVEALMAECWGAIEPYGKAADPLRELAQYVAERTQ